jgi:hypothetical protein
VRRLGGDRCTAGAAGAAAAAFTAATTATTNTNAATTIRLGISVGVRSGSCAAVLRAIARRRAEERRRRRQNARASRLLSFVVVSVRPLLHTAPDVPGPPRALLRFLANVQWYSLSTCKSLHGHTCVHASPRVAARAPKPPASHPSSPLSLPSLPSFSPPYKIKHYLHRKRKEAAAHV